METGSDVNNYPLLLKVQNTTTTYVVVITHRFLLNVLKWVRKEDFHPKGQLDRWSLEFLMFMEACSTY